MAPVDPGQAEELFGVGDSRYPELGNTGYEVDHYTVDLTFDPDANTINSLVTIEATATEPLRVVPLDFIGFDVTNVQVGDATAPG
jgi:aminopeptidase N